MTQGGEDFGFALKADQSVSVRRQGRWQDLDGDLAFQLRVRRSKYLPHAAFADRRGDFVDAEAGAWSESQVLRIIERARRVRIDPQSKRRRGGSDCHDLAHLTFTRTKNAIR